MRQIETRAFQKKAPPRNTAIQAKARDSQRIAIQQLTFCPGLGIGIAL
jgi:hypothetical protein